MNWILEPTEAQDEILALHHGVFGEAPTASELRDRLQREAAHLCLVRQEGGAAVGFAIFLARGQDVHLWRSGVLPGRRRQGVGACILEQGERLMAERGYSRLTVTSFNRWNVMLSMLLKRQFRIVSLEYDAARGDTGIKLVKELRQRREMRYAITEKCNFRCIFCHNEGLGHEQRARRPEAEIQSLLAECVRLGYTDVTFTGGEALLDKPYLLRLLGGLRGMAAPPDVTLVTNGSLLDDQVIQALVDHPGARKIHLSLHASDEATFQRVTGVTQPGVLARVERNIRRAAQAGLTVKVNHVILRDINHAKILQSIEHARSLGATAIKLIELLVLPDSPNDYDYFYELDAIREAVQSVAGENVTRKPRKDVYLHKADSRFTIELQRCTCALGCDHCRESRDRTFSSDMSYHPCFVRHKKAYPVGAPADLPRILKDGDRIIDGYAHRYRGSSPTLIQRKQYVARQAEFFFRAPDPDALRNWLIAQDFSLRGTSQRRLEYYWPRRRDQAWNSFQRVLKLGWELHNQRNVHLYYTDHHYAEHPDLGLETLTTYLDSDGPMTFHDLDDARRLLDRLDFESYFARDWKFQEWRRAQDSLSLALAGERSSVRLQGPPERVRRLLARLSCPPELLVPLREPLIAFARRDASEPALAGQ